MDAAALMLVAYVGGRAPQGPASVALPLDLSAQARRTACQARPGRAGWSWRLVDGRRCWHPGRRRLPKPSLYWPAGERTPSPSPSPLPRPRPGERGVPMLAAAWPAAAPGPAFLLPSEMPAMPALQVSFPEGDDAEALRATVWPALDAPAPLVPVRTIRYRAPAAAPRPPPPPRPPPAFVTLMLWGIGLGSACLAIAAARRPRALSRR